MCAAQGRSVINKIVQRREPDGKGWQTWRGMVIKLWTSDLSLLLCFAFPMKTVSRTDGADFISANRTR